MISETKIFFLILFSTFFFPPSFSQPVDNMDMLKPSQLKKFAENALSFGDIYSGIDLYERYIKLKPEDKEVMFELAGLYQKSRDYRKAADTYLKCYEKGLAKALFPHAQMQKSLGDYKGAKANFLKFQKENKGGNNDYKKILKAELEGCEMGIADANPAEAAMKAEIRHLDASVNKPHIEFSPVVMDADHLLYGSLKVDGIEYYSTEGKVKKPVRKFYTAKKDGKDWKYEGEFNGPFNEEGVHVGNGTFSKDGNTFYFTRCEADLHNKVTCSVYFSRKEGGNWTPPEEMQGINIPGYTTTMPAMGEESKKKTEVLYFVSDRPGGEGGMDIWYSVYDSKKQLWAPPKNPGSKLNTPGDDITPYYDIKRHTLYFSTDNRAGFGGMDVFKSNGELNKWTKPENIGYPLNTGADEVYFTQSPADSESGFFTSNREGGAALKNPTCCDDIYEFRWKDYKNVAVKGKLYDVDFIEFILEMEDASEKHKLIGAEERYLLDSALVSIYLIDKENEEPILITSDTTNSKGEYFFKIEKEKDYKIVVNKDRYYRKHLKFTSKNVTAEAINQHIGMNLLGKEPVIVKNIYYAYDDASLNNESKNVIDTTMLKIMRENPHILVEISSHTDSKGADDYNITLSQKRAESVVDYLASKGIEKDRMQPKGYGETKPIAPNSNNDGSDNPDGRSKNRRTEFRVLGTLPTDKYDEIIYKD